ncbi:MAG: SRPBCC family protein [Acidobacteriota bacterium]
MKSFTTTIKVPQSPAHVFRAINDVRAWWTGNIDGRTDAPGEEFTYRYAKVHRTTQKITEWVPDARVVWHVTDSFIDFPDASEWTGTDIVFEIARQGDETEVRFTHQGLVPDCDCYEACRKGWTFYIEGSLRKLITTGTGDPNAKERG